MFNEDVGEEEIVEAERKVGIGPEQRLAYDLGYLDGVSSMPNDPPFFNDTLNESYIKGYHHGKEDSANHE